MKQYKAVYILLKNNMGLGLFIRPCADVACIHVVLYNYDFFHNLVHYPDMQRKQIYVLSVLYLALLSEIGRSTVLYDFLVTSHVRLYVRSVNDISTHVYTHVH